MTHSEAVAKQIDARLAELNREIAAHERALLALQQISGAPTRGTASNGTRRRRVAGRAAATNGAERRQTRTRATASNDTSQSAKPATAAATPRRRRRPASAEAVFEALKSGEDQATKIARQFGVSPAVVRNRLQQLEEAGRVSRTGNRRSTRWRSHAG